MQLARYSMQALIILGMVALGLSGCVGSTSTSRSTVTNIAPNACFSGFGKINGVNVHSFCGTASAQVTVGEQHYTFSRGECFDNGSSSGVNIGRIILDDSDAAMALKKQSAYFGVGVKATKDGTYPGVVTGYDHDQPYIDVSNTSITLSNTLSQGALTGTAADGTAISGTWTCQ